MRLPSPCAQARLLHRQVARHSGHRGSSADAALPPGAAERGAAAGDDPVLSGG